MIYTETAEYFRDGYAFGTLGADTTVRFDNASNGDPRTARLWASSAVAGLAVDMTADQVAGLRDALNVWLERAEQIR